MSVPKDLACTTLAVRNRLVTNTLTAQDIYVHRLTADIFVNSMDIDNYRVINAATELKSDLTNEISIDGRDIFIYGTLISLQDDPFTIVTFNLDTWDTSVGSSFTVYSGALNSGPNTANDGSLIFAFTSSTPVILNWAAFQTASNHPISGDAITNIGKQIKFLRLADGSTLIISNMV